MTHMKSDLILWVVEGSEERQPLDVVHVGVSKEKVGIQKVRLFNHDLLAEQPDSRPGIDYHSPCATSNLETGGVTTIFYGIRTWAGDTPARAPKLELK